MRGLTSWFIRNPVAANLAMLLILFMGVQSLLSMRIEGFPKVPTDRVTITVAYPDATAAHVDAQLTRRLERSLEGLAGMRSVTSRSEHGLATVTIRRTGDVSMDTLVDRVRLRVGGIEDLPERARRPVIEAADFEYPALYANLSGQTDPATLQELATRLKAKLLAHPDVSRLSSWGLRPAQIRVELVPDHLRHHGLTLDDVAQAIGANAADAQSGLLRSEAGTVLLHVGRSAEQSIDFATIPVLRTSSGDLVALSDIATISDDHGDEPAVFRFNGTPTVGFEILVGQSENLLEVSRAVRATVEDFRPGLPEDVHLQAWGDSAGYIADRLDLLRSNGLIGLVLVVITLAVFLDVRLAFWVGMGVPISVLGALALAGSPWIDSSLNDVTTFGLVVVLGILVDDAVVVGESVFEARQRNSNPILATEEGVHHVAIATVFGAMTTVAAFFPMMLIDNPLGKALAGFSIVVILALVVSLMESKLILPAHLARLPLRQAPRSVFARGWQGVQRVANAGLFWVRDRLFQPALLGALDHRYAVVVLFVAAALLGLGQLVKGDMKTVFFPDVPGQVVTIRLEMDARAPLTLTRAHMDRVEAEGHALNRDLAEQAGMDTLPIQTFFSAIVETGRVEMFAELLPLAQRPDVAIMDVIKDWEERVGTLEGVTEMVFSGSEDIAGGFRLNLVALDDQTLRAAGTEIKAVLSGMDGVSQVRGGMEGGQQELRLVLRPEAHRLGITAQMLSAQIGHAFGATPVVKLQRTAGEVGVIVQNPRHHRDTIDDLLSTHLRSPSGAWVPLGAVVRMESGYGMAAIDRRNGERMVTVAATVDRATMSPQALWQTLREHELPRLARTYPGLKVLPAGELEEIGEIKGDLKRALGLAALFIYACLAVPLKSFWQPCIILAIVPFGFVAAAVGHLIMDVPLSLFSFFGMLALTGVLVNDALVLITQYNSARRAGVPAGEAAPLATLGRFRAIFLTTLTTLMGMLPLLAEGSEQAQYLIPAAISLAFGELFGTALMLILLPVLLAVSEDLGVLFHR